MAVCSGRSSWALPMCRRWWRAGGRRRKIQAYRLADNKLALNAGWDPELLRLELGELKLGGFDLSLTGFGDLELAGIMADRTAGLTDPDDAPARRRNHNARFCP